MQRYNCFQFIFCAQISFWQYLVLASLLVGCQQSKPTVERPPNIMILLVDDMGYGDLGCYGGKALTPNLDELAEQGLRFTNCYAGGPNCSPSRVALLTGRSPARVGMYSYRPAHHPMHLRAEELTIAEALSSQGYQTAHVGKWHLGCLPQDSNLIHPQPIDQGFQYSLGTENNARPSHLNPVNFLRNGEALDTMEGYACQILANEVSFWLEHERSAPDPFFMYVAFHEPHAKIASPPDLIDHYPDEPRKDAEYLANIENLDLAIGRILDDLQDHALLENTLIFFASDNGSYRHASNGNLRAVKSYVYEGGIRVPGIISWKNKFEKSTISEAVSFVDLFPTICDVTGFDIPSRLNYDGQSILALLEGSQFVRKHPLFWFFYRTSPEMALRWNDQVILGSDFDTLPVTHRFSDTDMKYIRQMSFTKYELYNLETDPRQEENLFKPEDSTSISMRKLLDQKLSEIKQDGYLWKNLPAISDTAKYKRDWVRY
ncbi:MAG: sulfatase-like hydrolase/transferase [Saprospiraceae bacterium]|nr:sulfatase-like hydrolase/transferase [Saprospiraceae bacterium]